MVPQVVCLPGSVAPAADRYAPLVAGVRGRAELHLKDLELYRGDEPPTGYSIDMELDAVDELARSLGLDRFHMVGYSGGGMVSLAYAGTRPDRLLSLAVFEPARIPGELTPPERKFFEHLGGKLAGLSGPDFMSTFFREQVQPGVELPPGPTGPPNAEMRKRPAGIAALIDAFDQYAFDREQLRKCAFPVFYAYGSLSHDEQALKATILAGLLPDIHVRRFDGLHHFVPPSEIYTREHADELLRLWGAVSARG